MNLNRDCHWHLNRVVPHTICPGDFLRLLNTHRHSRVYSIGVERNRWGERIRQDMQMPPSGTVWIALPEEKLYQWVVPANCVPYTSVVEMTEQQEWSDGSVRKLPGGAWGWRPILADALREGWLRPSERLGLLIGEDPWKRCPQKFWL